MEKPQAKAIQAAEDDHFNWFKYQYLQQVDPKVFDFEFDWSPALQQRVYDEVFQPDCLTYPPSKRYEVRLLKRLLEKLEEATKNHDSDDDFVNDDLMSHAAVLRALSTVSEAEAAQQKSYVTYGFHIGPHDDRILGNVGEVTLLESRSVLFAGSATGLRTWEAALHLGSYLCTEEGRSLVRDRNVIELGAGTALLSILCARHLGARHVIATDGDGNVMGDVTTNLFLNNLDGNAQHIDVAVLRWGSYLGSLEREQVMADGMDVVLGADIVNGTHSLYEDLY